MKTLHGWNNTLVEGPHFGGTKKRMAYISGTPGDFSKTIFTQQTVHHPSMNPVDLSVYRVEAPIHHHVSMG